MTFSLDLLSRQEITALVGLVEGEKTALHAMNSSRVDVPLHVTQEGSNL